MNVSRPAGPSRTRMTEALGRGSTTEGDTGDDSKAIVNSVRGVVVAPQPLAAETGADLLSRGGNAFDAAIGAAFVQMVTDPQMCGLGGFGCATYAWSGGCQH